MFIILFTIDLFLIMRGLISQKLRKALKVTGGQRGHVLSNQFNGNPFKIIYYYLYIYYYCYSEYDHISRHVKFVIPFHLFMFLLLYLCSFHAYLYAYYIYFSHIKLHALRMLPMLSVCFSVLCFCRHRFWEERKKEKCEILN